MKNWMLLALLLFAGVVVAQPDVQVNGLFKGRAMMTINGVPRLMKEGDISPEGVKLMSADSKQAVVEIAGKKHNLRLTQRISSSFSEAQATEVKIPPDPTGHYWVGGSINGRRVQFMVDTGATVIAMSSKDADRMGIQYLGGEPGYTSTAGGVVKAFYIDLPKVTVGSITVLFVKAAVLEGDFPQQILLGNSFLNRVEMEKNQGVLVLKKNH